MRQNRQHQLRDTQNQIRRTLQDAGSEGPFTIQDILPHMNMLHQSVNIFSIFPNCLKINLDEKARLIASFINNYDPENVPFIFHIIDEDNYYLTGTTLTEIAVKAGTEFYGIFHNNISALQYAENLRPGYRSTVFMRNCFNLMELVLKPNKETEDHKKIRSILEDIPPDMINDKGETLLHFSIRIKDFSIFSSIMKKNININWRNFSGETAIDYIKKTHSRNIDTYYMSQILSIEKNEQLNRDDSILITEINKKDRSLFRKENLINILSILATGASNYALSSSRPELHIIDDDLNLVTTLILAIVPPLLTTYSNDKTLKEKARKLKLIEYSFGGPEIDEKKLDVLRYAIFLFQLLLFLVSAYFAWSAHFRNKDDDQSDREIDISDILLSLCFCVITITPMLITWVLSSQISKSIEKKLLPTFKTRIGDNNYFLSAEKECRSLIEALGLSSEKVVLHLRLNPFLSKAIVTVLLSLKDTNRNALLKAIQNDRERENLINLIEAGRNRNDLNRWIDDELHAEIPEVIVDQILRILGQEVTLLEQVFTQWISLPDNHRSLLDLVHSLTRREVVLWEHPSLLENGHPLLRVRVASDNIADQVKSDHLIIKNEKYIVLSNPVQVAEIRQNLWAEYQHHRSYLSQQREMNRHGCHIL